MMSARPVPAPARGWRDGKFRRALPPSTGPAAAPRVPPADHGAADRRRDQPAEERQPRGEQELHQRRDDHEGGQQRQSARRHRRRRHADERTRRAHVEGIAGPERSHRPRLQDGGETADHEGREHRPLQPLGVVGGVEDDNGNENDARQDDAGDLHAEAEGQPIRRRFVDGVAEARIRRRPSSRVAHETTPRAQRRAKLSHQAMKSVNRCRRCSWTPSCQFV